MDHRLFEAARTGDTTTLEHLLQEDPLLLDRIALSSPDNPLHVAAFSGQDVFAKEILRLKPSLAMELNQQGFSPLHIASASGALKVVKEILNVGKRDVCLVKGKETLLPLHCAAQRGRSEVIRKLVLVCPESLKEVTTTSLETPLHVAVKNNQVEATKVLLEEINTHDMAPDILNWQNGEGNTVLHLAILAKHVEIVEMLIGERPITLGVNPNISNEHGLNPKDILDLVLETEGGSIPEMYKLVQIFQKVEAINAKEANSTNPNISHQASLSRYNIRNWNIDWDIELITADQRAALLVVAVLIATITYQSIISPPSLLSKTKENGGGSADSIGLSGKVEIQTDQITINYRKLYEEMGIFTVYITFNAVGFLSSALMISRLTKPLPLKNFLRLCVISMMATYITILYYLASNKNHIIGWLVIALSICIILREIVLFTITLRNSVSFNCHVPYIPFSWR